MTYPRFDAERKTGRFKIDVHMTRCISEMTRVSARSAKPDTARVRRLDELLSEAARDSVRVLLWWTPMHPKLSSRLRGRPELRQGEAATIEAVEAVAKRYNVPIVDLRDPASFGADSTDWYDCVHYGYGNAHRIARALVGQHVTVSVR
jgi:hypothetical protein